MKVLAMVLMFSISSGVFAFADNIECTGFPLPVSVQLQASSDLKGFEGHAQDGFFAAELRDCKKTVSQSTLETVTCSGNWTGSSKDIELKVLRNLDGTFTATLFRALSGGKKTVLGCVVKG